MGKNLIIQKFQIARLDEWIGDIRNANLIYEEILASDNKLSYFLEETIRLRKASYEKYEQLDFGDMEGIYFGETKAGRTDTEQIELSRISPDIDKQDSNQSAILQTEAVTAKVNNCEANLLYQEDALKPRKNLGLKLELTNLKYSVSITAKSDKYLKLELRGYHPEENKPDINVEFKIIGWRIKDMEKSKSRKKICRELYLTSKEDNLKVYLTVDQWGLVNGTVIIDEKNLGDALVGIHRMLYELCNQIWKA